MTIVGERDDPRTQAMQRAALATYAPNRRVHTVAPNESEYPYPGAPVAYICTQGACSLPIGEPADISAGLERALSQ